MERKDYFSTKDSVFFFFKKETVHMCAVANLINHTHRPTLTLNNIKPDRLANGRSRQLFPQISKISAFCICICIYAFLYLNNTKPDWIPAKRTALVGNFLGKQKITWKVWTRVARRGLCEIEIDQQQKKTLCIEIGIHFFFQAEISPKLSLNKEHLTSCQNLWLVLATFSLMCSSSVLLSRPAFSN